MLHVIQTPLQKIGRNPGTKQSLLGLIHFKFLAILLRTFQVNMYGSCSYYGLENLQFWFDKETTMYRQFHLQKKLLKLHCDLWKLSVFQMNRDNSGNAIGFYFGWQMSSFRYQTIEKKK